MVLPTPDFPEKAEAAVRKLEEERWGTPQWLQVELDSEVRRLMQGGYLLEIYQQFRHNSQRGAEIIAISRPFFQRVLNVRCIEYPITAHTDGVSFSVRAGRNEAELYASAFADKFVPLRLFYDLDEKEHPNGGGIPQEPPAPEPEPPPPEPPAPRRRKLGG